MLIGYQEFHLHLAYAVLSINPGGTGRAGERFTWILFPSLWHFSLCPPLTIQYLQLGSPLKVHVAEVEWAEFPFSPFMKARPVSKGTSSP